MPLLIKQTGKSLSILMTGATGFLGSAMTREFIARGHRVTALVRPASRNRLPWVQRLRVVEGDLRDENLSLPDERFDAIVHCAALPKLAGVTSADMERAHVGPASFLADFANATGTERFLHLSTAFVGPDHEGRLPEGRARTEECGNAYERTKTIAEHVLSDGVRKGLEIFRPGIIIPTVLDGPEALRSSPLGPFLQAVESSDRGICRLPARAGVAPGFCYRSDIIGFLIARLESESQPGAFWNLVSPNSPIVSEIAKTFERAGLCGSIQFTDRVESAAFRPWHRYLSRQRHWEQCRTRSEAVRMGGDLRTVTAGALGLHARQWFQMSKPREASA